MEMSAYTLNENYYIKYCFQTSKQIAVKTNTYCHIKFTHVYKTPSCYQLSFDSTLTNVVIAWQLIPEYYLYTI